MGNMVTSTSARARWRKTVFILFLPRLSLPRIKLYSTILFPIKENVIRPGTDEYCSDWD